MAVNNLAPPSGLGVVSAPVNIAVTRGDMLCRVEGGYAAKASASLTVAQENNATAGIVAAQASANEGLGANLGPSSTNPARLSDELSNGNIGILYTGDGTTVTTRLSLRIKGWNGQDIANVIVSSASAINSCRIKSLGGNRIAVAWLESATLQLAIYDNLGAVVTAAATVATLSTGNFDYWNINALANGDAVLAYTKETGLDIAFKRYNNAGALQGSETVVEAAVNGYYLCVAPLAAGGFVISHYRPTATAAAKFARYNASGTLQGSLTTLVTGANALGAGGNESRAIELTGGNIVFQTAASGDNHPDLHVYSSAGSLVKTIDLGTTGVSSYAGSLVATPAGFAVAVFLSTADVRLVGFNAGGDQLFSVLLASGGVTTSYNGMVMISLGASGFAILRAADNATNRDIRLIRCDSGGKQAVNASVMAPAAVNISAVWAVAGAHGAVAVNNINTTTLYFGSYLTWRKAMLGVALDSVTGTSAAPAICRVATAGAFTINQDFGPTGGGSFDTRANTVNGTNGEIAGASALLLGR